MHKKKILFRMVIPILATSLATACTASHMSKTPSPQAPAAISQQTSAKNLLAKGKVVGISRKAMAISIRNGKDTQIIEFTEQTKGMEHIQKGHAAIINYKMIGKHRVATSIKPKLAQLPPGTQEIQAQELATILSMPPKLSNYVLIDARPARRFAAGHIANAISMPAPSFKEQAPQLLPADKNKTLILYCGGPT